MMHNHLSCHDILKDEYALILADLKLLLNVKKNLMSYVKKNNLTSLTNGIRVSHKSSPTFANTVVIPSVTLSVTSACSEKTRIFTFSCRWYTFLIIGTFDGAKFAFGVSCYR